MNNKLNLTKPFITSEDIKVLVSKNGEVWKERYILSYDGEHYTFWVKGKKGEDFSYNIAYTWCYKYAKHIPPKRPLTASDAMFMLWELNKEHCVVVRHNHWEDNIFTNLSYLDSRCNPLSFQYGFLEKGVTEPKEWFDFPEDVDDAIEIHEKNKVEKGE